MKRRSRALDKIKKLTPSNVVFKRRTKFHKLPETTNATASSFTLSDTESASIESRAFHQTTLMKTHLLICSKSLMTKDKTNQTTNLVLIYKRFQISDRAGISIANALLKDYGLLDQQGIASIVERIKLRRERSKHREKIREEESVLFAKADGLYVDSKKDVTLVTTGKRGVQRR